jgi:hypothetical protein
MRSPSRRFLNAIFALPVTIVAYSQAPVRNSVAQVSPSSNPPVRSDSNSSSRKPLRDFVISKWAPTTLRGSVIWMDEYFGEAYFNPCYLYEKARDKPLPEYKDAVCGPVRLAINDRDLSSLQIIQPTFDENIPDDHEHPFYKVTLRNGVFFFGDLVVKRFEFDAKRDGFPARINYEWTATNRFYDRKDIKGIIASVRFPAEPKKPSEITYVDGRIEIVTNWRFIVGSKQNWNPTSNTISLNKNGAFLKIPFNDVVKLDGPSTWDDTTVLLADGRSFKGKIRNADSNGYEEKWHGKLDVEGVSIEMEAPYDYLETIEFAPGRAAKAVWTQDRAIFFK